MIFFILIHLNLHFFSKQIWGESICIYPHIKIKHCYRKKTIVVHPFPEQFKRQTVLWQLCVSSAVWYHVISAPQAPQQYNRCVLQNTTLHTQPIFSLLSVYHRWWKTSHLYTQCSAVWQLICMADCHTKSWQSFKCSIISLSIPSISSERTGSLTRHKILHRICGVQGCF